jgi:predicted phage terminase large subunit-like protein
VNLETATRAELLAFLRMDRAATARERKRQAEQSLLSFVELMWHAVEPETPFVSGWVLEAICEHLEAVSNGELTRLLMNVPPGSTKSLVTSVFWPAWEWGPRRMPHLRYLCCAYAQHLTARDNRRFKRVLEAPLYQKFWGSVFRAQADMYSTVQVGNDKTGWKLASSVGGVGTGERADRVIIDDPNNPAEAESELVMRATTTWFREVMPDRLNSLERSAIVVIQQRTHDLDVSGTILDLGLNYCHLSIPMLFDIGRKVLPTDIGWVDPRALDEDGEVLEGLLDDGSVESDSPLAEMEGVLAWPERFSEESLAELQKEKGSYAFSAQYQMLPVPRGGGIIKEQWWQLWAPSDFPEYGTCVASLDTAFKTHQEADYSALTVWAGFEHPETGKPKVMLREAWQDRLNLVELVRRVVATCREHKVDRLLIEDASRGGDVAEEIGRLTHGREFVVELIRPAGDKVSRMNATVPVFENGIVYAPDRDWADMVIRQVSAFPYGRHDDLCDTVSQALIWLRANGVATRREEYDAMVVERRTYRKPLAAVYDV